MTRVPSARTSGGMVTRHTRSTPRVSRASRNNRRHLRNIGPPETQAIETDAAHTRQQHRHDPPGQGPRPQQQAGDSPKLHDDTERPHRPPAKAPPTIATLAPPRTAFTAADEPGYREEHATPLQLPQAMPDQPLELGQDRRRGHGTGAFLASDLDQEELS